METANTGLIKLSNVLKKDLVQSVYIPEVFLFPVVSGN